MKILIRCDSSINIGTGHVIRCLNLAQVLADSGHEIVFVSRLLEGNVVSLLEKHFRVVTLNQYDYRPDPLNQYDLWRGAPLKTEIAELQNALQTEKPDWVISDSYSTDLSWDQAALSSGVKLFVIDDIFRPHKCHALLDQNFHQKHLEKIQPLISPGARLFLGPEYAMLNQNFKAIPPKIRNHSEAKNVLIFFGGTDPHGETLRLVKILKKLNLRIKFDIVAGTSNPLCDQLTLEVVDQTNFKLHIQTNQMPQLMDQADLFIGAGGSTTWERCSLGLPGLCIAIADNQISIAKDLDQAGIHRYVGLYNQITDADYEREIQAIIKNKTLRQQFSENSLRLAVGSKFNDLISFFN